MWQLEWSNNHTGKNLYAFQNSVSCSFWKTIALKRKFSSILIHHSLATVSECFFKPTSCKFYRLLPLQQQRNGRVCCLVMSVDSAEASHKTVAKLHEIFNFPLKPLNSPRLTHFFGCFSQSTGISVAWRNKSSFLLANFPCRERPTMGAIGRRFFFVVGLGPQPISRVRHPDHWLSYCWRWVWYKGNHLP